MQTEVLRVEPDALEWKKIERAAAVIRRGGLVAFPTETVYGLGANALDEAAVERIFIAKGRPFEDPLIVHIGHLDMLPTLISDMPKTGSALVKAFWPGPLTLVLPKSLAVPTKVTAGLGSVAVRMPANPVALALLKLATVPIAAPSANKFGHTSPTTATHVLEDLGNQIDMILDGGATTVGVESTVLDLSQNLPKILRPGGVTREAIESLIGVVAVHTEQKAEHGAQVSPGLLDSHYAPRAHLVFCAGEVQSALAMIKQLVNEYLKNRQRIGLLLADEDQSHFQNWSGPVSYLGSVANLDQIARNLYAGMRSLDQAGVEIIIARNYPQHGLGLAINDRLTRAASRVVK